VTDIVEISSAKLDPRTGMVTAVCKGAQPEGGDPPDYGSVNMVFALGFAAVPAPANDNGSAQGVLLDDAPGQDGVVVGAVDSRTTQTYYELGPGETVVFSTGDGFDSRIFLKDGMVALVVDDDLAVIIDRKNKQTTITGHGCHWEQSKKNGTVFTDETGKASIQLKNGTIALTGTLVMGGRTPKAPMGLAGSPAAPVPGVFAG
jgi:hypothetical protein